MATKLLIVIPIIIVVLAGIAVSATTSLPNPAGSGVIPVGESSSHSNMIRIDDAILDVQIADTDVKRTRGLMFEEQIPHDQGMLFVYEESGKYSFWMHNVEFALDIVWFDHKGNVVHIEQNVPPCTTEPQYCEMYDPGAEALYVFEETAGFVDMFGINNDSKFCGIVEKAT